VVVAFAFVTTYFTGMFPPYPNVNELSRFQAIYSFVENGTFVIDEALRVFQDHEDKAAAGGHFYSNKAPGLALAGTPVYRALRSFFPVPRSGTSNVFVLVRLLTVSAVCIFALARFWRFLAGKPGGRDLAPLITLAVAFGTPYLFYARSFFSHAWSAALLFLSFDLLRSPEGGRRRVLTGAAAGFLASWAAISEYPVAVLSLLLALRALSGRAWKRFGFFALGAAIPIALLLTYNVLCFDSPWVLSTAREAHPNYAGVAEHGLFGIGPPSLKTAWAYLFHNNRGLLLASPFWLWSILGFFRWGRSREERSDFALALAATLFFFFVLTGYPNWEGGWCLGSRYLLPVLFFAALPLRWALSSPLSRGLFVAATVFSVANHFLLTSAFPYIPPSVPWPVAEASWWFLARGWVAPNLGTIAGFSAAASLLLPVAALLLAALYALRPVGRTIPAKALAALAGLALLAASLFWPREVPAWDREWRKGTLGLFIPYSGD